VRVNAWVAVGARLSSWRDVAVEVGYLALGLIELPGGDGC